VRVIPREHKSVENIAQLNAKGVGLLSDEVGARLLRAE
jgi:hypothetical protein